MGQNTPARAATVGELVSLRSPGQSSRRYLAIQTPQVIYSARINQTFTDLNTVAELTYDTGSGTLANVLEGMTLYIGSSAGARDKGIVRIRKVPTSLLLYIAETSVNDVQFSNNDYLTVVNLMPPYPRDLRVPGGVPHMDFDLQFGTIAANLPMPILGPIAAVINLELDPCGNYIPFDFTPPDPSESFSAFDADVVSFLFSCPGAASTAGLATTTPTFTIDTPGEYRWSCMVSDENGLRQIGYRWLFVNPENPIYNAEDPEGDTDSGQFSFEVEAYQGVTVDDIPERAMVVMYEIGYYDQAEETLGPIEGYENVKCVGWIEDESIEKDPETGLVRFRVQGPAFWLEQIRAFPFGVVDVSGSPTSWIEIKELTVDKGLSRLLTWYTNAAQIMDCRLTGNTNRVQSVIGAGSTLWEQITSIGRNYLFANPVCNQFGQLFIEVDSRFISSVDRDALPVIMDIEASDIVRGSLVIERRTIGKKSMIELGGIGPFDGSIVQPYFSRAPGDAPKIYGPMDAPTAYIFNDQDDCNFKAGCMLAIENNEYDSISFELAHNNPFISIAPAQYLTMTIQAGETPRGVELLDVRLIPRRISPKRDRDTGAVQMAITCEVDVIGVSGQTYYPRQPPQDNLMDGFGDFGFSDFPAFDDFFPGLIPPPLDLGVCEDDVPNGPFTLNWSKRVLYGSSDADADRTAEAYFPCTLRANSSVNDSILLPDLHFYNGAEANTVLTAIKAGANVLTIDNDGGVISGIGEIEIDGFRIVLAHGTGGETWHPLQDGSPAPALGSLIIESGNMMNPSQTYDFTGLTPGNWYVLRVTASVNINPITFTVDGHGPVGNGGTEITFDGENYDNAGRPSESFGFCDSEGGIHFRDYRLLFLASKDSYTVAPTATTVFGGIKISIFNATIFYPRVTAMGNSQLFNVCP